MSLHERLLRLFLESYKASALIGDLEEEAQRIGASPAWVRRQALRHIARAGLLIITRASGRTVTTMRLALRDGWRSIRRFKATSAAAVVILALSIAAAAVTFAVVDTIVLRPLPYAHSERLVSVFGATPLLPRMTYVAPAEYFAWRRGVDAFENLAAWRGPWPVTLKDERGSETATYVVTTSSLFDVVGARPIIGAGLTEQHEVAGKDAVAVISYGVWQRRFGGSADILGRELPTPGGNLTIVGVMPQGFAFPVNAAAPIAFWRPYVARPDERTFDDSGGKTSYLEVIGRLKPGRTLEDARTGVERVIAAMKQAHPMLYVDWRPRTELTLDAMTERVASWMRLVLAAVVVLMAIGCVNVSNLLLTRSALRTRDIAIRSSLGATYGQVMAMLLVESLLLSAAGIAAGLVTAGWLLDSVKTTLPTEIPRADAISLDARVLIACAAAATGAALLAGLVPAWQASRVTAAAIVKGNSSSPGRRFWQRALLMTQAALVSALLLASTLLVGSFVRVMRMDLGFSRHSLAGVRLNPAIPSGPDAGARTRDFYIRAVEGVRAVPGVSQVALLALGDLPLYRRNTTTTSLSTGRGAPSIRADLRRVSPEYFDVAGIRFLQGRAFTTAQSDDLVAVIDDFAAQQLFPGVSAIGRRIPMDGVGDLTVVGVAANVKLSGPEGPPLAQIYRPLGDEPTSRFMLIRTSGRPSDVAPAITTTLRSLLPTRHSRVTVDIVDEQFRTLTADRRFSAGLMSALGVLALIIGVSGVYATTASLVAQQKKEIGIRMALGATASHVVQSVTAATARLLLAGAAAGLVVGWAASGLLSSVVFGISVTDGIAYAIPLALVVGGGCLAALLPARRAARIDPLITLRTE